MPGTTLYVYGAPFSGKTHIKYELLLNLSEFYGWKHAIFDPETGNSEDIIQLLTEMKVRKDFHGENRMSEHERLMAEEWLNDHFYIVEPGIEGLSLKGFYKEVQSIEQDLRIQIQTTSIDPWDDIEHDYSEFEERDDRYLTSALKYIRRNAKESGRYNIVITHVKDQQPITKDGQRYYPPPTPREIALGQSWFRKGMAMVGIWKPPVGLLDDNGQPYEWNEIHLIPHKQKPKGVAIDGPKPAQGVLYWDPVSKRYYEKDALGSERFATAYTDPIYHDPATGEFNNTPPIESDRKFWEGKTEEDGTE